MAEPHDLYPAHHCIVPFAGILDTCLNDMETHRHRNLMFQIEMLEAQFFRFFVRSVSDDDLTVAVPEVEPDYLLLISLAMRRRFIFPEFPVDT